MYDPEGKAYMDPHEPSAITEKIRVLNFPRLQYFGSGTDAVKELPLPS